MPLLPYHEQAQRDFTKYRPHIPTLAAELAAGRSGPDMRHQRAAYEKDNLKLHLCNGKPAPSPVSLCVLGALPMCAAVRVLCYLCLGHADRTLLQSCCWSSSAVIPVCVPLCAVPPC